jgi:dipeptidyl aminopeptidase/acylaminoacyl peptidase
VSPDGEHLAVSVVDSTVDDATGRWNRSHRVLVLALSSGEARSIPLMRPTYDPAWSPNGEALLVTSYDGSTDARRDGTPRVLRLAASDGRELGVVTPNGGSDADWAVTGEIAYVHEGDIWATRLGELPRRLTTEGGAAPSWSPDGNELAFERAGRVWVMRADGGDPRALSPAGATAPTWSPDGRYIAFAGQGNEFSPQIWVMHADGRCPRAVGVWAYLPFWRPLPGSPVVDGRPPCGAQPLVKPDLTNSARRVRLLKSTLRYRFSTVARIAGRAIFRTRVKALVSTPAGVRRRHLILARVRFKAGANGVVRIKRRLSPRSMRILRRNRALRLRVAVSVRDGAGDSAVARRRLTLIAPSVRAGRDQDSRGGRR